MLLKSLLIISLSLIYIDLFSQDFLRSHVNLSVSNQERTKISSILLSETDLYTYVSISYPIDIKIKYNKSNSISPEGQWEEVIPESHINKNDGSRYYSQIILGFAKYLHLLTESRATDTNQINIEIVSQIGFTSAENSLSLEDSICQCYNLNYYSRTDWGCPWGDESENFTPEFSALTHFVVHHQEGNAIPPYDAVVRAIWDYHVNVNGWSDIGYHWLIDPNGKIYKGRAWLNKNENVLGAHMCSCNQQKIGICLLGDFTHQKPTLAQYNSLIQFLGFKACQKEIIPDHSSTSSDRTSGICMEQEVNHLIGHRDGCPPNYTQCPGEKFYEEFDNLVQEVLIAYEDCLQTTSIISHNFNAIPNIVPNPFEFEFSIQNFNGNYRNIRLFDTLGNSVKIEINRLDNRTITCKTDCRAGFYYLICDNQILPIFKI